MILLNFYLQNTTDHQGRTLPTYWQANDTWLEQTHHYIQWMFPLFTPSQYNPHAPELDSETRQAFIDPNHPHQTELQKNLTKSLTTILQFYGYQITKNTITPTQHWEQKSQKWRNNGNHNHLRITRILRSTNLLGLPHLATAFNKQLQTHSNQIPQKTLTLWQQASHPLHQDHKTCPRNYTCPSKL